VASICQDRDPAFRRELLNYRCDGGDGCRWSRDDSMIASRQVPEIKHRGIDSWITDQRSRQSGVRSQNKADSIQITSESNQFRGVVQSHFLNVKPQNSSAFSDPVS
jgi:hypothetical protein